mgnify:CR=1 FL=1
MSQRITSESEVEEVMMQLGVGPEEELRESQKRKNTLEKFAQLRSRDPETTLKLDDVPTAFVQVEEEVESFRNITIPTKRFQQQITDLPDEYHDYLMQRAAAAHEVGHVLYSDYSALKHFMNKCKEDELQNEGIDESMAEQYQDMFQFFYNALEDGAIERYLADDFRVGEELVHLRATLHEDNYFGKEYTIGEGETEYHYPFFFAVMVAVMNLGVYDNGELWKLLDEDNDKHFFAKRGQEVEKEMFEDDCLPKIRKEIPKIQGETDSYKRTERIYELWKEVRKFLNRSTTPGRAELQTEMNNSESDSYIDGVPENLSPAHGDQEKEPIPVSGSGSGGDEEAEETQEGEGQTFGEERGDKAENGHENEGVGSSAEEKAEQGIQAEAKQDQGDWSEEIEEIINALGAGDGVEEIMVAEDGSVDTARLKEAKRQSKRTSRLFARRLRHMTKDKTIRNKERGNFDSRALIPAERGSTRCFKQTKEGDDKDYRCMIVLDRSGSMSGRIEDVELAAGAIAWGLENNGVDTSILDTESSQTTLSKPFGVDADSFKQKIFAGRCSGGTPLTGTMKFARQRMSRGKGDVPFAIVVTDGRPRNEDNFKEQVRKANFPVLGLYLTNNKESVQDQLSLYDKAVVAGHDDDVNQILINLINQIIF